MRGAGRPQQRRLGSRNAADSRGVILCIIGGIKVVNVIRVIKVCRVRRVIRVTNLVGLIELSELEVLYVIASKEDLCRHNIVSSLHGIM